MPITIVTEGDTGRVVTNISLNLRVEGLQHVTVTVTM